MTVPRRLLLDTIPADFDPTTHVAFGPWCFYKAETTYPDWENLPFVDAFPTPDARCAAGEACRALAHKLLSRLWPTMNARHGTAHGQDFWHVVLMDWLIHLVMLSWRLWRHTEVFIERVGSDELDVGIATASRRFQFSSTEEFVLACFGRGEFRLWLAGEIVRRQAPKQWRLREIRLIEPAPAASAEPASRRRKAVEHVAGLGRWQRALAGYVRLLPRRRRRGQVSKAPTFAGFPQPFFELLDELVETTLPESFRAGFAAFEREASAQTYRRGQLYAGSINFHDDQGNITIAHAVEAGERIIAVQHGGAYGWAALLPLTAEVEYARDVFATWGWTKQDHYSGRFVPFPSPLISRLIDRHADRDNNLVFVGNVMYAFNPRLDIFPSPLRYRSWKRPFIVGLDSDTQAALVYRPYSAADCFEDTEYLRRYFPWLRTIDDNFHDALLRARLVVQDHCSTTMSITMGANIPSIFFWDKEAWPLAASARPLFEQLEKAGILFYDPVAAARQANAIWSNVQAWWWHPTRQAAREAWSRQFALAKRAWAWDWFRGLTRLSVAG